jgi:RNA polymerase sigma-B factor
MRSGVEYDDLVQVGCLGLMRAIQRFDPSLGRLFEAYASTMIVGEIMHYLRDSATLIRPPRELTELRSTVRAATCRLEQQVQREPSSEEIARMTGLCPAKVEEVVALDRQVRPLSLDAAIDAEDEASPMRLQLVDQRQKAATLAAEDHIMVSQALARLGPKSREVIELAFFHDLPQQEVGRRTGVSQTQVSRRLRAALKELCQLLNDARSGR